jgi:hypothetical protein
VDPERSHQPGQADDDHRVDSGCVGGDEVTVAMVVVVGRGEMHSGLGWAASGRAAQD